MTRTIRITQRANALGSGDVYYPGAIEIELRQKPKAGWLWRLVHLSRDETELASGYSYTQTAAVREARIAVANPPIDDSGRRYWEAVEP